MASYRELLDGYDSNIFAIPDYIKQITNQNPNDYANNQIAGYNNETQEVMKQYQQIAENRKNALELNKTNQLNQIDAQRPKVEQMAQSNAKQAYINKMLAQRDMGQTLAQSGLTTTGQSGTAYGSINNSYGENVNKINSDKANQLLEIDNQLNTAKLTFAQQEQDLLADIESKRLELQENRSQEANKRYQQAIANYMEFKNQETQLLQLDQQFKQNIMNINQGYNSHLDDLKQRQFENDLAIKQYNLALQKAAQENQKYQFTDRQSSSQQNNGSNGVSVDWNSVNNLGYGPVNKNRLDQLVNSGNIVATVNNGKISYSKVEKNNNKAPSVMQMWNRY